MALTRRHLLAGMAAGATRAAAQFRAGNGPKLRTTPAVCLYSQVLIKVPYDELGAILRSLNLDGCDLSVQPGGHVVPEQAPVDMMRAVEAVTGVGLDVPVISTVYTTLNDQTIRNVAAISGQMGVPLFRAGLWHYGAADPEARLAEVQRDIAGLAALARAVKMSVALQNAAGDYVGAAVWDLYLILRGLDPQSAGYAYDPGYAAQEGGAGASDITFKLVLPRLKMAVLRDFVWAKDASGAMKAAPCPLGEGVVEYPKFFAALARQKFVGPLSIQVDYHPADEIGGIRKDVAFVRKQLSTAYGG